MRPSPPAFFEPLWAGFSFGRRPWVCDSQIPVRVMCVTRALADEGSVDGTGSRGWAISEMERYDIPLMGIPAYGNTEVIA